tara:strand:- start:11270 stop:12952 length:1683 start_codon:yes stop_codon:yes gene_type:complete
MSELPNGWQAPSLVEICAINPKHDQDTDRSKLVSFVPMPAVSDKTGTIETPQDRVLSEVWKGYTHFQDGDVIFAKITPCMENGKIAVASGLTNGLACGSTEFYVMRPDGGILPDYIWRFVRQVEFRKDAEAQMSGAVGQRRVPKTYLEQHLIPLPPIPEQQRIVRKLDTLIACTATVRTDLNAIPTLVERYKLNFLRSVFRGEQTAAFRNENELEPVSDLLERVPVPEQGRGGRKATDEIIPGKGGISVNNPGIELPERWDWVPLLRVARQETGHTPSRSHPEWWGGDVCWLSIPDANTHHGRVIHDTVQKTNDAGLANSSARLLPEGTVVLSRTASVGYVTILGREMATSQDFATWTCSEALEPRYLMYALLSEGDDIRDFGEGTTHTTIYFPEIRAFNIKLAPIAEQCEIVRRIETAFAKIDRLAVEAEKALTLTDRLDQRILAKAFAGELVPQDPNDEPAGELLDRIREARVTAPKKPRQRRTKANAMKKNPQDLLIADSAEWPEKGLPFEDVAKRVVLPHHDLRDALFSLLGAAKPKLEQVFDKDEARILLKRAAQ